MLLIICFRPAMTRSDIRRRNTTWTDDQAHTWLHLYLSFLIHWSYSALPLLCTSYKDHTLYHHTVVSSSLRTLSAAEGTRVDGAGGLAPSSVFGP